MAKDESSVDWGAQMGRVVWGVMVAPAVFETGDPFFGRAFTSFLHRPDSGLFPCLPGCSASFAGSLFLNAEASRTQ